MALVDERRKTLSARLDNTRFRVELEATKHEAAKAWKHAWEEAESEYAKKETKLANQLEMDRLKLERDLAEVTKLGLGLGLGLGLTLTLTITR